MSNPVHLARRFFGSLSPRPLDRADAEWVESQLLVGEVALWHRMGRVDRKHACGVARTVDELLSGAERAVIAAAALHDVGKVDAGYGTFRRAAVTAMAAVVGRKRIVDRGGRPARYLKHDALGADLLRAAGADPLTVAWAREHHLARSAWTVPVEVGEALVAADND